MSSISLKCTLFLTVLLLSSALCIRSDPAACAPPAPSCGHLLIPPPSLPLLTNPSDMTPPLFNQSQFFFLTNLSSIPSPFTIAFADELLPNGPPPSLALALFRSPWNPLMEINFNFSVRDSCADADLLLSACDSTGIQQPTSHSCKESERADSDRQELVSSVSLTHYASSAALLVQAKVNFSRGGLEINQTFTLNSSSYAYDAYIEEQDDNIVLFLDYVTRGHATINISTLNATINISIINDAPSPPFTISSSDSLPPPQNHSKSTHATVTLWVVVGVSIVAFMLAAMILAFAIKKRYRQHPPLARSHLDGAHVALPTTTTRAPFPHPHVESNTTPMMPTLCLSPPYHTDNFQMSGMASWLKQPGPR